VVLFRGVILERQSLNSEVKIQSSKSKENLSSKEAIFNFYF
jgi:hypothetical protein